MIRMRLSQVATELTARLIGSDRFFQGCEVDSRRLQPGALFVAIRGQNQDGHAFVTDAEQRGAAALMVACGKGSRLPTVCVEDTRFALGELARVWRGGLQLPLVAVTGSNGKTTVKELLASIFRTAGPTLATAGNRNNDIGVPLTLFGLGEQHQFACIEMGANRPGEIARLTEIAQPTVGVITQCGVAHLEGFRTLEGVARAKGELFAELHPDATAVINTDDRFAPLLVQLTGDRRRVCFGLTGDADLTASWRPVPEGSIIDLKTPGGRIEVRLRLAGRHNVQNALAAASAALAVGLPLAVVRRGLEAVRLVSGRLERKSGIRGAAIIDDTYNANPGSLDAALEVLAGSSGRRWLVLGDMGELGLDAPAFHESAGELAKRRGVERLYAVGPLGKIAAEAFGIGGIHCDSRATLIELLRAEVSEGITVLVKGSRTMHMEEVVSALLGEVAESSPSRAPELRCETVYPAMEALLGKD